MLMKSTRALARTAIVASALALCMLATPRAYAIQLPGGGNARTDCYATFEVQGVQAATSTRFVDCIDGDPACDMDGACNDSCRFSVALCLNQGNNRPTCIPPAPPSALTKVQTRRAAAGLQVPPLDSSACGAFLDIDVPVKLRRGGRVKRPGRVKLPVVAVSPVRPKRDRDKPRLTCLPRQNQADCPAATTTTTTTLPAGLCGNGMLDAAEQCDPPGAVGQCQAGQVCTGACQCGAAPTCCPASRIVTTSSPGTLAVSTLPAFPFPAGVLTTIDVGEADPACRHDAVVPAGGFSVPVFCIPALGFTSSVTPTGCEAGGATGRGTIWDAAAPAATPDVVRVGDTSDPSTNACGTLGAGCNAGGGGAGADTNGNVDTVRGGPASTVAGVHTQLDIPVVSLTWNDVDGNCPDDDSTFNPGTDTLVSQFDFILSPTTGRSQASFTDLNGDSCSFAGNGPLNTRTCSNDPARACGANSDCPGGTCQLGGSVTGSPATGPCCQTGQATTVVATGLAFSGGSPLFDLTFTNVTPSSITSCEAAGAPQACTLTTNACLD
jgi:hypothetical protein